MFPQFLVVILDVRHGLNKMIPNCSTWTGLLRFPRRAISKVSSPKLNADKIVKTSLKDMLASTANLDRANELLKQNGFIKGNYKSAVLKRLEICPPSNIKRLSFVTAIEDLPEQSVPEVAFIGRSNVGKSSLVNYLLEKDLVTASEKPGQTKKFQIIDLKSFRIVDLPGYGFAFGLNAKQSWPDLLQQYLKLKRVKKIFVLVDSRHGLKKTDLDFLTHLDRSKVRFQIILTKCDLPPLSFLTKIVSKTIDDLAEFKYVHQKVLVFSVKREQTRELLKRELLGQGLFQCPPNPKKREKKNRNPHAIDKIISTKNIKPWNKVTYHQLPAFHDDEP